MVSRSAARSPSPHAPGARMTVVTSQMFTTASQWWEGACSRLIRLVVHFLEFLLRCGWLCGWKWGWPCQSWLRSISASAIHDTLPFQALDISPGGDLRSLHSYLYASVMLTFQSIQALSEARLISFLVLCLAKVSLGSSLCTYSRWLLVRSHVYQRVRSLACRVG